MPRSAIRVGDVVRLPFIRGTVVLIVNGEERGWHAQKYMLIKPTRRYDVRQRLHWVRQDELLNQEP